jgi:hypothetical protein
MTGKRTSDDPAKSAKTGGVARTSDPDAPAAAAKASVHEAIGKLIGDDAEQKRGAAEREATGTTPGKPRKSRSPK